MNNLLKRKPKLNVFERHSTEAEVYEQIKFHKLIVEDRAGVIRKKGNREELIDKLYAALKDYRLKNTVKNVFDSKKYEVSVKISSSGNDRIAEIVISKRRLLKRLIAVFRGY